jgi:uncharacterized protein (DUF2252 family)
MSTPLADVAKGDPVRRGSASGDDRAGLIVDRLAEAFADLMAADPAAFRTKFRKMAADPFAFYRGSAAVFYADVARREDPWADERTSRIWVHGDLHSENFGTYMDGQGRLVFDVNDFDEAFLGHFAWDLQRLAASVALLGWQKALPEEAIDRLVRTLGTSYAGQVSRFAQHGERIADHDGDGFPDVDSTLDLSTAGGPVLEVLLRAKLSTRVELLDGLTVVDDYARRFRHGTGVRLLEDAERAVVTSAIEQYVGTIPEGKRLRPVAYTVLDVVGRSGFGIGSAGLPAYNVLVEGHSQSLDNDVVLSVKQGHVPALRRVVDDERAGTYFDHEGHRTAVSQRALQSHADPLLGWAEIDGTGYVVSELSPYAADLDWSDLTEPDDIERVLEDLGRATARAHCVADEDSDQSLVDFQTEEAIAGVLDGREEEFCGWLSDFAVDYALRVREDHTLFVDAFRAGRIPGVSAT